MITREKLESRLQALEAAQERKREGMAALEAVTLTDYIKKVTASKAGTPQKQMVSSTLRSAP